MLFRVAGFSIQGIGALDYFLCCRCSPPATAVAIAVTYCD